MCATTPHFLQPLRGREKRGREVRLIRLAAVNPMCVSFFFFATVSVNLYVLETIMSALTWKLLFWALMMTWAFYSWIICKLLSFLPWLSMCTDLVNMMFIWACGFPWGRQQFSRSTTPRKTIQNWLPACKFSCKIWPRKTKSWKAKLKGKATWGVGVTTSALVLCEPYWKFSNLSVCCW